MCRTLLAAAGAVNRFVSNLTVRVPCQGVSDRPSVHCRTKSTSMDMPAEVARVGTHCAQAMR